VSTEQYDELRANIERIADALQRLMLAVEAMREWQAQHSELHAHALAERERGG